MTRQRPQGTARGTRLAEERDMGQRVVRAGEQACPSLLGGPDRSSCLSIPTLPVRLPSWRDGTLWEGRTL